MNTYGKLTVRGANILIVLILILQWIISFASMFFIQIYMAITGNAITQDTMINILLISTQIFAVFIPAVLYLKLKGVSIKETIRFEPIRPLHIVLIITMGISGQFIAQVLNLPVLLFLNLLGEIPPPSIPMPHNLNGLILSIGIIGLMPAIAEELMMRGIIMRAYEIRGTRVGLIISSIFFGLIHGDIKNLIAPIFFGLVFGYCVIRTGSIFAGVIAHFMNNSFAVLLGYIQENYAQQFPFLESGYFFIISFFIAIILFIPAFSLLRKTTKTEMKPAISSKKADIKAAFLNTPIILTLIIYLILQVFQISEIINNAPSYGLLEKMSMYVNYIR